MQVQRRFPRLTAVGLAALALAASLGTSAAGTRVAGAAQTSADTASSDRSRLVLVDVVELHRRQTDLAIRRDALRTKMAERAISLYIDPGVGLLQQLVTSSAPNEAARRQALAEAVLPSEKALLDRLRGVELDLQQIDAALLAANSRQSRDIGLPVERAVVLPEGVRQRLEEVEGEAAGQEAAERSLLRLLDDLPADERLGALFAAETMIWPAQGGVSSEFGWRWGRAHHGIDITNDIGTPVVAARSGRVVLAKNGDGFGNHLVIDHGRSITTLYGHLSALFVAEGVEVRQGQVVAAMGCTGSCTGTHLHFEVRYETVAVDPRPLLPDGRAVASGD